MRAEGYLFNYPPTVITASIQRGEVQKLRSERAHSVGRLLPVCIIFLFLLLSVLLL